MSEPPAATRFPLWGVCVSGAVRRDGRYLICRRSEEEDAAPGELCFPGGVMEEMVAWDALESELRREMREETAGELDRIEYAEAHTFKLLSGRLMLLVTYLCTLGEGPEPYPADLREVAEVLWLTPAEVEAHPKSPDWLKRSLAKVEARRLSLGWP
jgi:8-oxo-dGTP diphosphatase